MMPWPMVAQIREPSSAAVTKSLSLEHQVGAIPGAPKACSELVTSAVGLAVLEVLEVLAMERSIRGGARHLPADDGAQRSGCGLHHYRDVSAGGALRVGRVRWAASRAGRACASLAAAAWGTDAGSSARVISAP